MKKIVLLVAFLCVGLGYAQTYRISTVGESKQFVIEDVTNGVRERPYLNREVLADTISNGNIKIFRQLASDDLIPIGFPKPKGHPYTAFLNGNNSDATFASAAAILDWFADNTGFSSAGSGSASTTVDISNVLIGESSDVVFDISVGGTYNPGSPYNYLTESHLLDDGKEDAYCQGGWFKDGEFVGVIQRQFPVTTTSSGSNLGDGTNSLAWIASFKVEGAFAFRVDGGDSTLLQYRVEVDGVVYTLSNNNNIGGGRRWMTVDVGAGTHYVKVIGSYTARWSGYVTAPNAIAEPWNVNRTSFYFGDSFTASTGASAGILGYPYLTTIGLNHNILSSGLGGTGYVNATSGYKLKDRIIGNYTNLENANGVPNEVIIAMGLNDFGMTGIEADANTAFDNLRTVYSGKVYVVGPWDTQAPLTPNVNYASTTTAIKNAIAGRDGFYFINMEGVAFSKSDGTHPDDEGHATLAEYLKKSLYPLPNTDALKYSERIASQITYRATGNVVSTNLQDAVSEIGNRNEILLTSPDGTEYKITVANGGTLSIVEN